MTPPDKTLNANFREFKRICHQLAQAGRLMVGVGNYENYLRHMQEYHPELPALSAVGYFRHCQETRYPRKGGTLNRCPC